MGEQEYSGTPGRRGVAMSRASLPQACAAMLRRDLTLAWRRRGDLAMPVLYAVIVTVLFPFALRDRKSVV